MKLWKILLATLIATLFVCGCVAMADECAHDWQTVKEWVEYAPHSNGTQHQTYACAQLFCTKCQTPTTTKVPGALLDCLMHGTKQVKPTCTADGYWETVCYECGRTGTEKYADKNGHVANKVVYIDGTCQKDCEDVIYCSVCGVETGRKNYGKYDHDYSKKVWDVPLTCTQDGYWHMVCKWCDKAKSGDIHMVLASHNWETVNVVPATCTEKGYTLQSCRDCMATQQINWNGPSHTWKDVPAKAPTCNEKGYEAHQQCTVCWVLGRWNNVIADKPWIPALVDGHKLQHDTMTKYYGDCSANNNYAYGYCGVCGQWAYVNLPAKEHDWPVANNTNLYHGTYATCTTGGSGAVKCKDCPAEKAVTFDALGHKWGAWRYSAAATCTTAMIGERDCTREGCNAVDRTTVVPATGHIWVEVKGTEATCTTAGKVDRKCAACGIAEYGTTIAAKGHDFTKVVSVVAPTCEAQGYTVYGCTRCDATNKGAYTSALGHSYSWVVVTKPSEAGNGKNEYTCALCKKVADTKTIKFTKYYYNNTMTSFGPTTKELVGGNDWYRVTPVDVSVDGVYTYDLVASNKYIVGKVTIAVNAGTLTVSYKANNSVDVKDESLLIYASKADLAAGSAVTAPVGAAINVAETFGADTKVLVSLVLTGDYDAAGKNLIDASAASAMMANVD